MKHVDDRLISNGQKRYPTTSGSQAVLDGLNVVLDAIPEPSIPESTRLQSQEDSSFHIILEKFDRCKHFSDLQCLTEFVLENQDCLFGFIRRWDW